MKLPSRATLAQRLLASKLPGKQRLLLRLANHFQSLQLVPTKHPHGATLYLDLRVGDSHGLLVNGHEPDEQSVISLLVKAGDTAVDVGAHLGVHTVLLSYLVGPGGQVYSFEPNPTVLAPLVQTVQGLANVCLLTYALSDERGTADFFVPAHASMASLRNWTGNTDGKPRTISCQTQRLDDLLAAGIVRQPDFIKCDVEGAELQVFRGAQHCLNQTDAPILLFEVNANTARGFGLTIASTTQYLRTLDLPAYRFFKVERGGILAPMNEPDALHSNIVAIPGSKIDRISKSVEGSN